MMRKLFLFGILSTLLNSCVIQYNNDYEWTYPEIKGVLIDSLTRNPIIEAYVYEEYSGEKIKTDSNGFFNIKARKEFIKYRIQAMDNPKPYIDLIFEKKAYNSKNLRFKYIKIDYDRVLCDTIDLKAIEMVKIL